MLQRPIHRSGELLPAVGLGTYTTFDVGNPAGNVIPSRAMAKFNIRFSTEHSFASLRQWVDQEIAAVRQELGGTWSVSATEGADVFITEPGSFVGLVQDAVERETGVLPKLSTSGGTSDARFVKDYCPVLEFGPTMERTWLCRKERASARISISSP